MSDHFRVLITGGLGFIGSHLVRALLTRYPHAVVRNIDCETYASMAKSLAIERDRYHDRYRSIPFSVTASRDIAQIFKEFEPHYVIHAAAESHVDNSIHSKNEVFWQTNAIGTDIITRLFCLQWQKNPDRTRRMIYVSTDEVYGSLALDDGRRFTEDDPLDPKSPYSASKAGGELAVRSRRNTHAQSGASPPVIITRCSNNFGTHQFPEKLIPTAILAAFHNQRVPLYGDGLNVRDWISVHDHVDALLTILLCREQEQTMAAVYNIGAENEVDNATLIRMILAMMDKPESLIEYVSDRPGHDRRYALDTSRIRSDLDWRPKESFRHSLAKTVEWYLAAENRQWIEEAQKRRPHLSR